MQDVTIAKDLLDYLVAVGGLASAIAALIALGLTVRSAGDSKRSARAAEGILRLDRQERKARMAEEAKRPELDFRLQILAMPNEPDGTSVCRLELLSANTGQRPADSAIFSVAIGSSGTLFLCDSDGNPKPGESPIPQDGWDIQWGEGQTRPIRTSVEQTIPVNATRVTYFSVVFPASPGVYVCLASLYHEGIELSASLRATRSQKDGSMGYQYFDMSDED